LAREGCHVRTARVSDTVPAVLVLAGPTASGKTEAALALAERFDAEIIGADSRQIYCGMPIGTAAPTPAQRARAPYHLVAFLDPHERYSAARYVRDALAAVAGIHARGRRAIVAGGTGFYLRALCGDVVLAREFAPALRARLEREAGIHPPEVLHDWLRARDPRRAASVPPGDAYRIVRALEIALARATGVAVAELPEPPSSLRARGLAVHKVVLAVDDAELDARIVARVDAMLAAGLLEEAERVGPGAVAADAVGYPQALAYLAGASTADELRAALIRATRRYAKRQRTWFRSEPHVTYLEAEALADAARGLPGWA